MKNKFSFDGNMHRCMCLGLAGASNCTQLGHGLPPSFSAYGFIRCVAKEIRHKTVPRRRGATHCRGRWRAASRCPSAPPPGGRPPRPRSCCLRRGGRTGMACSCTADLGDDRPRWRPGRRNPPPPHGCLAMNSLEGWNVSEQINTFYSQN